MMGHIKGAPQRSHPGYIPSRYYQNTPLTFGSSNTTAVLATNSITYKPFLIGGTINIDRLAISVAGIVALGVARVGVYSNINGLPGSLLLDAGELAAATTGIKEAVVSLVLTPDWYWFAGATNSPPNLNCYSSFLGDNYILGQGIPASNSISGSLRHTGFTYGALPATAPTSNLSLISGNIAPLFWFRAA